MGQPQGDYPACSQKVLFVNIWPILWANPLTESPWIRMWQREFALQNPQPLPVHLKDAELTLPGNMLLIKS